MTDRKDDPDLSPEAALATDLGDPEKRRLDQLDHLGGELDEIDTFDPTGLDDGSDLDFEPEEKDEAKDADDGSDTEVDAEEAGEEDDADGDEDDAAEADDQEVEEAEGEGESDEDDDSEEADSKSAPKGIPKHRFDEVNERRKAAEKELAELRAEKAAAEKGEEEVYDFDAAEKEYIELTLDGDTEGALAKRREIRAAEHAEWAAQTKAETRSEIETDAETQELVALSREAEQMFDVFNPDHEDYNQPLLDKVLVYMKGYESSGTMGSRSDCFVAALADVVDQYGLMDEDTAEEEPATAEPQPTGKKKVDSKKAKLKEEAPTPVAGSGQGSADAGAAVPNIEDMSDEEFEALPEKTQARLRGDIL